MPPLNVVMSNPSAILGCSMHHLKGELGDAPKLKLSDDHKKVLEDSFQDLNKPMKIKLDRNPYPKAIEMPHDLCKKMVESEDESFANVANPRELLADGKRLCKIPAGFPFPLTTLNLRNNCTFSVSSISFSTCTVAELYLGENQFDNNPCKKKNPKPFKHKTTKKIPNPFLTERCLSHASRPYLSMRSLLGGWSQQSPSLATCARGGGGPGRRELSKVLPGRHHPQPSRRYPGKGWHRSLPPTTPPSWLKPAPLECNNTAWGEVLLCCAIDSFLIHLFITEEKCNPRYINMSNNSCNLLPSSSCI